MVILIKRKMMLVWFSSVSVHQERLRSLTLRLPVPQFLCDPPESVLSLEEDCVAWECFQQFGTLQTRVFRTTVADQIREMRARTEG